jgi:hypothetical protein
MTYGIRPRSFAFAFWRAIALAFIAVVALGIIAQHVSTGWRMFVLARGLRSVWAATASIIAGIAAGLALDALAPARRGRVSAGGLLAGVVKIAIVLITAIGTLGYFMPDWTPLSTGLAALVLIFWSLAAALMLMLRG